LREQRGDDAVRIGREVRVGRTVIAKEREVAQGDATDGAEVAADEQRGIRRERGEIAADQDRAVGRNGERVDVGLVGGQEELETGERERRGVGFFLLLPQPQTSTTAFSLSLSPGACVASRHHTLTSGKRLPNRPPYGSPTVLTMESMRYRAYRRAGGGHWREGGGRRKA
jgi:hypothetical protein